MRAMSCRLLASACHAIEALMPTTAARAADRRTTGRNDRPARPVSRAHRVTARQVAQQPAATANATGCAWSSGLPPRGKPASDVKLATISMPKTTQLRLLAITARAGSRRAELTPLTCATSHTSAPTSPRCSAPITFAGEGVAASGGVPLGPPRGAGLGA